MAYKNLKPALCRLTKCFGPVNGERLMGMTPVGKMLGLGAPGSLERLRGNYSVAPPKEEKETPCNCYCGTPEMQAMFAQDRVEEMADQQDLSQVYAEECGLF